MQNKEKKDSKKTFAYYTIALTSLMLTAINNNYTIVKMQDEINYILNSISPDFEKDFLEATKTIMKTYNIYITNKNVFNLLLNTKVKKLERITELIQQEMNSAMISDYIELKNLMNSLQIIGKTTWKEQVEEIKKQWGQSHVYYTDKNGKRIKMKSNAYFNRVLRTEQKNAGIESCEQIAKQLNTDIYEYSSHANPRIKCAEWEGRLIGNTARDIKDKNGRKIHVYSWGETSYGEADGVLGINCRHLKYPYIEGLSIPLTDDMMRIAKNEKKINAKTENDINKIYKDQAEK